MGGEGEAAVSTTRATTRTITRPPPLPPPPKAATKMSKSTPIQDFTPQDAKKTEIYSGDSSLLYSSGPSMPLPPATEPNDYDFQTYSMAKEALKEDMSGEEAVTNVLMSDIMRTLNDTDSWGLFNMSEGNTSDYDIRGEGDVPLEMVFNSSHIITIAAYSCLFVLSALGNISVLKSIAW